MYEYDTDEEELPKRNPVYCAAIGGVLDLDEDDLGYPHIPDLWNRLRADKRPVPQRGLYCPTCIRERPSQPEWMIVYERGGQKIAAHHNPQHKAHATESDEHLAYKERIVRAAQLGGFQAQMEVRGAEGKLRSDVQIIGAGGKEFGFEPQLSYQTDQAVRRRDRIRRDVGITPVWHITNPKAPLIDHVWWSRTDNLPPEAIRDNRDVLVRGGIRGLDLEKCDDRNPLPCRVKKTGRCGLWHPNWEVMGRQLDDLVRGIAAGEFVQVAEKLGSKVRRFWTPASDRERYLENGGLLLPDGSLVEAPALPGQRGRGAERRDALCTRDRDDTYQPVGMPPRDGGESYRPAVTMGAVRDAAVPAQRRRRASDLSTAEVWRVAAELGCQPSQVGPCGRCYGPTVRYGPGTRVLCSVCRPAA